MRCKKGDMAFISSSRTGKQIGLEVTCLAFVGVPEFNVPHDDIWRVDREVEWGLEDGSSIMRPYVPDSCLTPIRPRGDKEDVNIYNKEIEKETTT